MLPAPPTHSAGRECPFCTIAHTYPPLPLTTFLRQQPDPKNDGVNAPATATGTAHLLLSTPSLLAFLDIMPLTRGHILLATREHYEKLSDVPVTVGKQIGQWLPLLSRVVMRTLFGVSDSLDATTAEWNWNVVQNNGVRAAQQVPHVHFHLIPRPNLDSPRVGSERTGITPARSSFVMFGRGQREELDDDEGEELVGLLREELAREVVRVREDEGVDMEVEVEVAGGTEKVKGKL